MSDTHDKNGRPWLKLSKASDGQVVELDSGFSCHSQGNVVLQMNDRAELYFKCADGKHLISGQADDGEHCIGIYSVE